MNIGDKFRIKNESGIMDVVIKENIYACSVRMIGILFPSNSKIRWEFHNDGYFGIISTLYNDSENNREIYIAQYESDAVSYYKGFIEKFERENFPVYQTI